MSAKTTEHGVGEVVIVGSGGAMGSVFQDADVEPTDGAIRAILGERADLWEESTALFAAAGAQVSWQYHRDGGWRVVEEGFVRITFSSAERHLSAVRDAHGLTGEVREPIQRTPPIGKLLPVTFEVGTCEDVVLAGAVLTIKLTAK